MSAIDVPIVDLEGLAKFGAPTGEKSPWERPSAMAQQATMVERTLADAAFAPWA